MGQNCSNPPPGGQDLNAVTVIDANGKVTYKTPEGKILAIATTTQFSFDVSTNNLTKEEIDQSPQLSLVVQESTSLAKDKTYVINAGGLKGSNTQAQSTGLILITNKNTLDNSTTPALVLEDPSVGKNHGVIYYHKSSKRYFIKDNGNDGAGTYLKVEQPIILSKTKIFVFGSIQLQITLGGQQSLSASQTNGKDERPLTGRGKGAPDLEIKFLTGPQQDKVYKFTAEKDPIIKVGRMDDCAVMFESTPEVSRYQLTVFNKGNDWVLEDGFGSRKSRNGVYMYLNEFFPLLKEMRFRIGSSLYLVKTGTSV